MEQAVYQELKEICQKIINAGPDMAPSGYLAEIRALEEKLILLDYLQYRQRSLTGKTASDPGNIDQELLDTLKRAEEQMSENPPTATAQEGHPEAEDILPAKEQIAQTPEINFTKEGEAEEDNLIHEPEDILPSKEQITQTPPISLKKEGEAADEELIHEPEDILPAKELVPEPTEEEKPGTPKQSINESFAGGHIKLGLNDRLAFTKHLFAGSQEDLNRVISQLNTFTNYTEALQFVEEMVKPDYNWSNEAEYEERLMDLIKARFGAD
jgi:hypothetical protein